MLQLPSWFRSHSQSLGGFPEPGGRHEAIGLRVGDVNLVLRAGILTGAHRPVFFGIEEADE